MRVAIVGEGLQGTCVALESAARGVGVHLIESNAQLMGEASRHNEGKIHLGFVYANDLFVPDRQNPALALRKKTESADTRVLGFGLERVGIVLI